MEILNIEQELKENSYPGRGLFWGKPLTEQRQWPHILLWEEARTAGTVSS